MAKRDPKINRRGLVYLRMLPPCRKCAANLYIPQPCLPPRAAILTSYDMGNAARLPAHSGARRLQAKPTRYIGYTSLSEGQGYH